MAEVPMSVVQRLRSKAPNFRNHREFILALRFTTLLDDSIFEQALKEAGVTDGAFDNDTVVKAVKYFDGKQFIKNKWVVNRAYFQNALQELPAENILPTVIADAKSEVKATPSDWQEFFSSSKVQKLDYKPVENFAFQLYEQLAKQGMHNPSWLVPFIWARDQSKGAGSLEDVITEFNGQPPDASMEILEAWVKRYPEAKIDLDDLKKLRLAAQVEALKSLSSKDSGDPTSRPQSPASLVEDSPSGNADETLSKEFLRKFDQMHKDKERSYAVADNVVESLAKIVQRPFNPSNVREARRRLIQLDSEEAVRDVAELSFGLSSAITMGTWSVLTALFTWQAVSVDIRNKADQELRALLVGRKDIPTTSSYIQAILRHGPYAETDEIPEILEDKLTPRDMGFKLQDIRFGSKLPRGEYEGLEYEEGTRELKPGDKLYHDSKIQLSAQVAEALKSITFLQDAGLREVVMSEVESIEREVYDQVAGPLCSFNKYSDDADFLAALAERMKNIKDKVKEKVPDGMQERTLDFTTVTESSGEKFDLEMWAAILWEVSDIGVINIMGVCQTMAQDLKKKYPKNVIHAIISADKTRKTPELWNEGEDTMQLTMLLPTETDRIEKDHLTINRMCAAALIRYAEFIRTEWHDKNHEDKDIAIPPIARANGCEFMNIDLTSILSDSGKLKKAWAAFKIKCRKFPTRDRLKRLRLPKVECAECVHMIGIHIKDYTPPWILYNNPIIALIPLLNAVSGSIKIKIANGRYRQAGGKDADIKDTGDFVNNYLRRQAQIGLIPPSEVWFKFVVMNVDMILHACNLQGSVDAETREFLNSILQTIAKNLGITGAVDPF